MKRKGKTPLIVLLVIFCVAFCGFVAMFFVDAALNSVKTVSGSGNNILDAMTFHWNSIKAGFTQFTPSMQIAGAMPWYFTYINLGVCLIFLVGIIIGIIVCVKKAQKIKILYLIPTILVLAAIIDTICNYGMYVEGVLGVFTRSVPVELNTYHLITASVPYNALWTFIGACCILVFVVLFFVIYGLGLAYVCRYPNNVPAIEQVEEVAEEQPAEEQPVEPVAGEYAMASLANDETVVSEPVAEPEIEIEPVEDFAPVVEPEAQPAPAPVMEEVKAEEPAPAPAPVEEPKPAEPVIDEAKLAALLKDVVRDIVRDEIARNNLNQPQPQPQPQPQTSTVTGATFGGPLVVQYFNGGINGVTPAPIPAPAPAPAPVEPAPAPAPAPVEEKKETPSPAPTPVVKEVKPEAENTGEKKTIERIPFTERLLASDKELQAIYNELKNELLSWGVKSRVSNAGDTFRLHTKTYARITVAGKSLKFHFALDPKDYQDTTIPVSDAGDKNLYADIPLVFKVKSGLSVKRAKQLIQDCCEKDGLEQGEVLSINWIKELKAASK